MSRIIFLSLLFTGLVLSFFDWAHSRRYVTSPAQSFGFPFTPPKHFFVPIHHRGQGPHHSGDENDDDDEDDRKPPSLAVERGRCSADRMESILIEIKDREQSPTPFLTSCHNRHHSATLYTRSYINGPALNEENCKGGQCPRAPKFDPAGFYDFDIEKSFKKKEQNLTLTYLLGPLKAAQYFRPDRDHYFAKGHLVPNADGARKSERKSTFYYVNTVPQWQVINSGNWAMLEDRARDYAKENNVVLSVWTGAEGVLTLKDQDGRDREIYLAKTRDGHLIPGKLPVPRLMWKVLHDPESRSGVAIVIINDPYRKNHLEKDKNMCHNVCEDVGLVNWITENAIRGYTICCSIREFSNRLPNITDLRDLGDLPLLRPRKTLVLPNTNPQLFWGPYWSSTNRPRYG